MFYIIGIIFILIAIWQLFMTWQTFTKLKKEGTKDTSSFITLALSNSLLFAVIFFGVGAGYLLFNGYF
ncbi:hypothetical protein N0K71_06575 [Dellaglioa algida]|uniref:Uncharacterized protein n=1 Tax=Dellaglioa algida DSM 15638 TaxID=1423719 RepID=A0A0R1HGI0_9LACO|nr:hypothetical protein [Dellaglioa algida]KRK45371.1 hypothetical protein FC66_GL001488 [Dellaglioa algida DSM 15638]MDK1733288.1 hypothetical protein [Dellaglioa algida]MDK1734795.1 hypothetical protein [Dellaglioa algida]